MEIMLTKNLSNPYSESSAVHHKPEVSNIGGSIVPKNDDDSRPDVIYVDSDNSTRKAHGHLRCSGYGQGWKTIR